MARGAAFAEVLNEILKGEQPEEAPVRRSVYRPEPTLGFFLFEPAAPSPVAAMDPIAAVHPARIAQFRATMPRPAQEASPRPVQEASPRPVQQASPRPVQQASPRPVQQAAPRPVAQASPRPAQQPAPRPVQQPASPRPVRLVRPLSMAQRRALNMLNGLGARIGGDFTSEDLRRAFRRLARQLHPDRHPNSTQGEKARLSILFAQVIDAYKDLQVVVAAAA